MTLWSTYWTARSTFTRGIPSCSNCMHAIVPVASWSSVWSMRRPIGSPRFSSPSTRCSFRIWRDRFSGMSPPPVPFRWESYPIGSGRDLHLPAHDRLLTLAVRHHRGQRVGAGRHPPDGAQLQRAALRAPPDGVHLAVAGELRGACPRLGE